ncbi:hypothetical protein AK830_g4825 [Neonectria ditissima]|uniref:Uncharacterized protein n=1 Tax=Neonectria ditissima TaxID=78410 RepID=A0A0P7B5M4_9HYPO|nr:hypothetical protein AK830_g4825 [Neonectria ditissima]
MRLINARTLLLREFYGENIPPYAILSHTWGDQEVTFQDWKDHSTAPEKSGYAKIHGACSQALLQGIEWVWVDTNCIDKSSSAELTEAINSMFMYYQQSNVCFAYLGDVPSAEGPDSDSLLSHVRNSRWFTRGWTLQELLAPEHLTFYAADWTRIGSKDRSLSDLISDITGIDRRYLNDRARVKNSCVAKRMSWLAKRTTTRVEDMAYCMLGIFDINMPLLYGEGVKAFTRLQEEIIKSTNDHTIFCWTWTPSVPKDWASLLAPSPEQFECAGNLSRRDLLWEEVSTFSMTNAGLSIRLPLMYALDSYFVVLEAGPVDEAIDSSSVLTCVQVKGTMRGNVFYVARSPYPPHPVALSRSSAGSLRVESLLVMNRISYGPRITSLSWLTANRYPYQVLFFIVSNSRALWYRWGFELGRTPPAVEFDSILSTITLEIKAHPSGNAVGVAMVPAWVTPSSSYKISHKSMPTYLFVGVKVMEGHVQLFSQLFVKEDGTHLSHDRYEESLYLLREQVLETKKTQQNHCCESLGVSVVIDKPEQTMQSGQHFGFLHLSECERSGDKKDLRQPASDRGDSSIASDVAGGDKNALSNGSQRGIFRLPGLM